jgi:metal-responsive CopG/Arc/MetJ family transcriptional regulator
MSINWKPLNVLVDVKLYNQVDEISKTTGLSKAQITRFALRNYIKSTRHTTDDATPNVDDLIFDE